MKTMSCNLKSVVKFASNNFHGLIRMAFCSLVSLSGGICGQRPSIVHLLEIKKKTVIVM